MKKFLFILVCILLTSFDANATSTITPNIPAEGAPLASAPIRNNFNAAITDINALQAKFPVSVANGGTGATTAQGALNSINSTPIGNAGYQTVPCQGFSDEQSFATAAAAAQSSNLGALLYRTGCVLDSQWKYSSPGRSAKIFGFGGSGNEKNTAQGGFVGPGDPYFRYYIPAILANAPGQTAIDVNGASQTTFNGVNAFNETSAATDIYMGVSFLNNSTSGGGCCNQDTVNVINSSLGGGNTIIGFPVDNDFNPIQNGGVRAGTLTAGGTGYVDGTYYNVALTGGSGSGMKAAKVVVSGGIVTSIGLASADGSPNNNRVTPGGGYVVGNVLGVNNANLGGSGSGLQYTVSALYTRITGGGSLPNMLPHFMNSFFSDESGCALCSNFSDAQIIGNTFTAGQAIQQIFGGGANQITDNKFEDNTNAVDLGGVNGNGFIGGNVINNNVFTTNSFGGGFDLLMGRGTGWVVVGNEIDSNFNTPINAQTAAATASFIVGGNAAASLFSIVGNVWKSQPASTGKLYCIDIPSGFTTDYVNMSGNVCSGTTIVGNVHYGQTPTHIVEDFVGPFGIHREQGRQWAIGYMGTPRADFDIGSLASTYLPNVIAPIGSTQLTVLAQSNASVPSSSNTAYYKLDDASGSTAIDAVSAANGTWHGTLGSQWGTGIINGDGVFNGTDNYISTTYAGVTGTGARSFSMWVKTTSQTPNTGQGASSLLVYGTIGSGTQILINTNDKYGGSTNFPGLTFDPGGGAITYSAPTLFDGNWHHVVVTTPASLTILTAKIYLDGALLTTVSHSFNTSQAINTGSTNPVNLGGYSGGFNFNGQIDEASMWNRQLTAGEVLFLYNNGLGNQYPYSAETQSANILNIIDQGSNSVVNVSGAGYLGIGTSVPTSLLHVGSATASGVGFTLQNSSGTCTHAAGSSSETVSCSSDAELKKNIQNSKTIMPWLWSFHIRSFDMRSDNEHKEVGVIAQEVMQTHPEMVHDGPNGYLAVEMPDPWYLVKALQEVQSEINLLAVFTAGNFIYICGIGFFAYRNRRRRKLATQTTGEQT